MIEEEFDSNSQAKGSTKSHKELSRSKGEGKQVAFLGDQVMQVEDLANTDEEAEVLGDADLLVSSQHNPLGNTQLTLTHSSQTRKLSISGDPPKYIPPAAELEIVADVRDHAIELNDQLQVIPCSKAVITNQPRYNTRSKAKEKLDTSNVKKPQSAGGKKKKGPMLFQVGLHNRW